MLFVLYSAHNVASLNLIKQTRLLIVDIIMNINVLAFGVAKDILGGPSVQLELANDANVYNLKYALELQYPRLKQLATYMVAVNNEYALPEDTLHASDEIAIIPPVSGG